MIRLVSVCVDVSGDEIVFLDIAVNLLRHRNSLYRSAICESYILARESFATIQTIR